MGLICIAGCFIEAHATNSVANLVALLLIDTIIAPMVGYRSPAEVLSIFGDSSFGRWVVTHSLADFDFHDHRPAVKMNQHPLWYPMSE